MIKNFDEMQKLGKDNVDMTMKSFGALSKASQTIATEITDYSKKSFEDGTKVLEKLFGAKSLDKAMEIQADYARRRTSPSWRRRPRWANSMPISPRKATSPTKPSSRRPHRPSKRRLDWPANRPSVDVSSVGSVVAFKA